ncbi:hypothetical protein AMECASPLE_009909 [Ameca splendens]|uniref:Uncharacterized protein n=1 Tax=Ameca splendens TaxID=208324 RepID=A0ABV0XDE5_9TELE
MPLDFTVNRASPLVTKGQSPSFPLFQACRVRAARQFSEYNPVILAPFSLPPFLLMEHTNRAWKMASLLGQKAKPDLVVFSNIGSPSTPLWSHRNECILGSCKVNGPQQTKEIKFGNLAVTGVLSLSSDHTEGSGSCLTRCSVCLPDGTQIKRNFFTVISNTNNNPIPLESEVIA